MSSDTLTAAIRHLRGRMAPQGRNEESDEQLLSAFTTYRDEDAFAVLVRRHGPMVLHVCRRVLGQQQDAEDAFQAVFLLLVRNAADVRNKSALAGFLHGAAYRIALTAKRSAARRRKHESEISGATRPSINPVEELSWREVRTLVDEEISRLPAKYRTVFVLCHLENLSQAEAARRLGMNERTLSSRLTAARKCLGQRLARRGVELTAALATTALAQQSASALPAELIATTVKAALATVTGEGVAGIVSASVAEMVHAAPAAMLVSQAKVASVVVLVMSMLAGVSVWAYHGLTASALMPSAQLVEPPAAQADDKKAGASKHAAEKTVEIQGRVLGPEGKPKAGAKLLLLNKESITELGVTEADGRFTLSVPNSGYLIARTNDAGIEFIRLSQVQPGKLVELRLVKDHAIRGRIVNTEGKAVPGVRIGIRAVIDNTDNALDAFLISRKNRNMGGRFFGVRYLWNDAAILRAATTDGDGRFTIHGIGANRLVYLRLSGASIAEEEIWMVNREGFDPKEYNQTPINNPYGLRPPEGGRERGLLFGPDASLIVEAEKPIHGIVTDADSGKGQPNVVVYLSSPGNAPIPVPLQATTDAEGRYEIHGCRKTKSYTVEVTSNAETGYMACQVHVADTAGYQPLRADIRIKKGVVVVGKVIERATGKSVPGFAETGVLRDNPCAKDYPMFNASQLGRGNRVYTSANGVFRIVTIPGPTLLMGGYYTPEAQKFDYIELAKYRSPIADPEYPQYFQNVPTVPGSRRNPPPGYLSDAGGIGLIQGNYCKVLDIKPGTAVVHQDIFLDLASVLEVKIQDAGGHPVVGVWATDFPTDPFICALWIERATCPVCGLEARKPRMLIFYEPKKKIIGSRKLQGDEKGPLVVTLGAMGAVKGRLLDADGKPLAGVAVTAVYLEGEAENLQRLIHRAKQVVTDAAGAFTLGDLIPDLKFDLSIHRGKRRFERQTKADEVMFQVKPGEYRDLGAIKFKQVGEQSNE